MRAITSTLTAKSQVTIPAEVRKALGLKPGDRVTFVLHDDEVRLKPTSSALKAGFGAVKPAQRPEDLEELRRKAREQVARKAMEDLQHG